jgi:hypothetical protein
VSPSSGKLPRFSLLLQSLSTDREDCCPDVLHANLTLAEWPQNRPGGKLRTVLNVDLLRPFRFAAMMKTLTLAPYTSLSIQQPTEETHA